MERFPHSVTHFLRRPRRQGKQRQKIRRSNGRKDDIISLRKQIRKSIARDRLEYKLQNFEEELWFDIKQAKAAYLPRHTKLREKQGE